MLIPYIYSHCPCNKANRQKTKGFSIFFRASLIITILAINIIICISIYERNGKKPESNINVINAPCNALGVLPIDEYFQLEKNCLDLYRTKTSNQYFGDNYQNSYAPHFNLYNSETVKDSLNYENESIEIQYNHLKEELQKQSDLRIPCIKEYFTQIKDIAYYNSPFYRGMKAIYISISMGIIVLLLILTFVKELFIDLKGMSGEEKAMSIFSICGSCVIVSLFYCMIYLLFIKKLLASPTHLNENFNNIDFEKFLLKC